MVSICAWPTPVSVAVGATSHPTPTTTTNKKEPQQQQQQQQLPSTGCEVWEEGQKAVYVPHHTPLNMRDRSSYLLGLRNSHYTVQLAHWQKIH